MHWSDHDMNTILLWSDQCLGTRYFIKIMLYNLSNSITAVLSSSIICGMPNAIVNIMTCVKMSKEQLTSAMYNASLTTNAIVYLGSCLNPIIYTLLRRDIR